MSGWKTYAAAAGIGLLAAARFLGWVSPEMYEALLGLLGAGAVAALRAGVSKVMS